MVHSKLFCFEFTVSHHVNDEYSILGGDIYALATEAALSHESACGCISGKRPRNIWYTVQCLKQ